MPSRAVLEIEAAQHALHWGMFLCHLPVPEVRPGTGELGRGKAGDEPGRRLPLELITLADPWGNVSLAGPVAREEIQRCLSK